MGCKYHRLVKCEILGTFGVRWFKGFKIEIFEKYEFEWHE